MDQYLYNMNRGNGQTEFARRNITQDKSRACKSPDTTDEVFAQELRRGISATRQFFFNHQHPDGYWVAELEGDALLQSETIMLLAFLGEENTDLAKGCAVQLLDTQLEDGGWGMYTGGKSDVNNTVKAYFALKLTGHDPAADYMLQNKASQRYFDLFLFTGGLTFAKTFNSFCGKAL